MPDLRVRHRGRRPQHDAKTLADNLVCPSEYVEFGAADDVAGHCEMTGRAVFHQRVYDWLDGLLAGAPAR